MFKHNLVKENNRNEIHYGDLIVCGSKVYGIVQVSACVYEAIEMESLNRKNEYNFYGQTIEEVLANGNFGKDAFCIKAETYDIIISNQK